ncbi:hypothetical protein PENTCL1PPCAC_13297, partial [Pristionchus entomophagus]
DETRMDLLLHFRNCIFRGIQFERFRLWLEDVTPFLNFIKKLMVNFTLGTLELVVNSELQLEQYLQLMADLPKCEYSMIINFPISNDMLHTLPPLNCSIMPQPVTPQDPDDTFLKLIETHRSLILGPGI